MQVGKQMGVNIFTYRTRVLLALILIAGVLLTLLAAQSQ